MNFFQILQKCRTLPSFNRKITISVSLNSIRWRLANGYPRYWTDRGTLTDDADFSYVDGRPAPYSSGQRARLLKQKEYTEKIIYFLNAMKFVKQRRLDESKEKAAEAEFALTRKLKWKGVRENADINEESKPSQKRVTRRKRTSRVNENVDN